MNPKYQNYADRIRDLIEEGHVVAKLERPSSVGPYIQGEDVVRLQSWLVKASNILEIVFGEQSPHTFHFKEWTKEGLKYVEHSHDVYPIVGILNGALDDLENGYLFSQEFLIAGEIFDSVLEQARHLNDSGYKDPSAVLARVVLEDALRRLASDRDIENTKTASQINDELRRFGAYAQPQWRLIQVWLDIGNSAAHGKFNEYSQEDVKNAIEGMERFLALEFKRD